MIGHIPTWAWSAGRASARCRRDSHTVPRTHSRVRYTASMRIGSNWDVDRDKLGGLAQSWIGIGIGNPGWDWDWENGVM